MRVDSQKGETRKHLISSLVVTVLLCLPTFATITNQVIAPLTYVGRSTEAIASVTYGSSLGSEVSAALTLPLNPSQTIFDNGAYWIPDITPTGVTWASWPIYSGDGSYQARHFQATFTLPVGLHNVVGFTLFSSYYAAAGNFVPVDDNAYFYLNGTYIGAKGTSYGAVNSSLSVPGLDIHETNGWHQDGSFGSIPVPYLQSGLNVLDIIDEDLYGGGGTGPLTVMLLDEVPEPTTWTLVAVGASMLLGSRAVRRRCR